jgi:hypothetical protein
VTYCLEGSCSIQLSYGCWHALYWSEREDSNLRPPAPKAGTLPGCATLRRCGPVQYSERYWGRQRPSQNQVWSDGSKRLGYGVGVGFKS